MSISDFIFVGIRGDGVFFGVSEMWKESSRVKLCLREGFVVVCEGCLFSFKI